MEKEAIEKAIIETPTVSMNRLKTMIIKWKNADGKHRTWEAVRRVMKNNKTNIDSFDDIVVVVPITDEGEIVFISQFRATVGAVLAGSEELIDESEIQIIEFPAGVVDEEGLTKKDTAMLELAEEAGFGARRLQIINEGPISAGMSFEYVTEYLALDLYPVPKKDGDEERGITVYRVPLKGALEWLEQKEKGGFVIDSRVKPLISLVKEYLRGE